MAEKTTQESLNEINEEFNNKYYNTALKKYGRRVSLVLPQSYDDSLTFYEAVNKLIYTLNGEIARSMDADDLIAENMDKLQALVQAFEGFNIAESTVIEISLTESNGIYTIAYKTADNTEHTVGTIETLKNSAITGITITNENGIYSVNYIINGVSHNAGTIEIPESNNPVIEVKDTVIENTMAKVDFHTFTETTNDGTENNIGSFYIAQNQITNISSDTNGDMVINKTNQAGDHTSETLEIGGKNAVTAINVNTNNGINTISYTVNGETQNAGIITVPQNPDILNDAWPIGSKYISNENVNPSTLLGGTWELRQTITTELITVKSNGITNVPSESANVQNLTAVPDDNNNFLAWLSVTTNGWVSSSFFSDPTKQTTTVWFQTTPSSDLTIISFFLQKETIKTYLYQRLS